MIQALVIRTAMPGLNEIIEAAKGAGGKGYRYAKLKREWTATIVALCRSQKLRPMKGPVYFQFVWWEINRRRDPDNIAAGGRKLILDGLVAAGVLEGDRRQHIAEWTDIFLDAQTGHGRVAVLMTELE